MDIELFYLMQRSEKEDFIIKYVTNSERNINFITEHNHGLVPNALIHGLYNLIPVLMKNITIAKLDVSIFQHLVDLCIEKQIDAIKFENIVFYLTNNYPHIIKYSLPILLKVCLLKSAKVSIEILSNIISFQFTEAEICLLGELYGATLFSDQLFESLTRSLDKFLSQTWRNHLEFWHGFARYGGSVSSIDKFTKLIPYQILSSHQFLELLLISALFDGNTVLADSIHIIAPTLPITNVVRQVVNTPAKYFEKAILWLLKTYNLTYLTANDIDLFTCKSLSLGHISLVLKLWNGEQINPKNLKKSILNMVCCGDVDSLYYMLTCKFIKIEIEDIKQFLVYSPLNSDPRFIVIIVDHYKSCSGESLSSNNLLSTLINSIAKSTSANSLSLEHLLKVVQFEQIKAITYLDAFPEAYATGNRASIEFLIKYYEKHYGRISRDSSSFSIYDANLFQQLLCINDIYGIEMCNRFSLHLFYTRADLHDILWYVIRRGHRGSIYYLLSLLNGYVDYSGLDLQTIVHSDIERFLSSRLIPRSSNNKIKMSVVYKALETDMRGIQPTKTYNFNPVSSSKSSSSTPNQDNFDMNNQIASRFDLVSQCKRSSATPGQCAVSSATPSQCAVSSATPGQCAVSSATPGQCAVSSATPGQCAVSSATPGQCAVSSATPGQCAVSSATPGQCAVSSATPGQCAVSSATPGQCAVSSATPGQCAVSSATPSQCAVSSAISSQCAVSSAISSQCAVSSAISSQCAVSSATPGQCAVSSATPSQCAVSSAISSQCAVSSATPSQCAVSSATPSQCAVSSATPSQCANGFTQQLCSDGYTQNWLGADSYTHHWLSSDSYDMLSQEIDSPDMLSQETDNIVMLSQETDNLAVHSQGAVGSAMSSQGAIRSAMPSQGAIRSAMPSQGAIRSAMPSQGAVRSVVPTQSWIGIDTFAQPWMSTNSFAQPWMSTNSFAHPWLGVNDFVRPSPYIDVMMHNSNTSGFMVHNSEMGGIMMYDPNTGVIMHDLNMGIVMHDQNVDVVTSTQTHK